jgi:hypothetical protein
MKKARSRKTNAGTKAASGSDEACGALMELVERYSYQGKQLSRLTNVTFWAGAGFSKAWEPSAPVGDDLFTLGEQLFGDMAFAATFYEIFGIEPTEDVAPSQLRQIVYRLDMYEKYPDLRSRYIDDQNIRMLRAALRNAVWKNFDKLSKLNYIDADTQKFPLADPSSAQRDILEFFDYLRKRATGGLITEGLRPQFVTTNYDFVIETILDNCEGPDDTLFHYTYRGLTPSSVQPVSHQVVIHGHSLVQHLLKLNGGFEILPNPLDGYSLHYGKRSNDEIAQTPPVLILPSREQDYTDPYFRAIFPKTVRLMRDSTILVLVGYSLPEDDALIRFILRQFAEEQEDGLNKYIFYVDLAAKRPRLVEVFPWLDYPYAFPRIFLYEGGFAEFAKECMSLVGT